MKGGNRRGDDHKPQFPRHDKDTSQVIGLSSTGRALSEKTDKTSRSRKIKVKSSLRRNINRDSAKSSENKLKLVLEGARVEARPGE